MPHFSKISMTRTSPKEKFQLYKAIHFTLFPFLKAIFAAMDPDPMNSLNQDSIRFRIRNNGRKRPKMCVKHINCQCYLSYLPHSTVNYKNR
jgi:hypothetical protein